MKKHYLLSCILCSIGIAASAQVFENTEISFPTTYMDESGKMFKQDSVYMYNRKEEVKSYEIKSYNKNGYESDSYTVSIDWKGIKSNSSRTVRSYDNQNNLLENKIFYWRNNQWTNTECVNYLWTLGQVDKIFTSKYDADLDEWFKQNTQVNEYTSTGALSAYILYAQQGVYEETVKDMKWEYSDYNEFNKPTKGKSYRGENGEWKEYMNIYYEYDALGNLIQFTYKTINEDGTEKNTNSKIRKYNELNQLIEETTLRADWKTGDLVDSEKEEYIYDETNHYLVESRTSRFSRGEWSFSGKNVYFWSEFKGSELEKDAQPLARIGSHWNYWVAQEHSFGFNKYKVVKDTVLTAPVYETGELLTAKASWIEKYSNLSFHGAESGEENVYVGCFGAIRIGNASYVYEPRPKKWFKWVDMDAELGDKWIVPEIISGKGVYDYVEVSFKDTLEVDGRAIPYIYLMPACTSRFSTSKDFTSRISMEGYFNIDFWSLYASPEPSAHGMAYMQQLREINVGLLCADVNGESLLTDKMEEYVKSNNQPYYDQGIIACDSLHAPVAPQTPAPVKPMVEENKLAYDLYTTPMDLETTELYPSKKVNQPMRAGEIDSTEIMQLPVVVHVIYNPETPEEKITEAQIKAMLDEVNLAYSTEKTDQVREVFKEVVGNPYVNFVLAETDSLGKETSGILYYETDKEFFMLAGRDIKMKYDYKFNADGSPRNWDTQKYVNIYIADLGGFDQNKNVGGFVTNPEPTDEASWELQKEWFKTGNPLFWQNWLQTEEGEQLDGLTLDYWHTFGGVSQKNPMSTFKTAIHELGHYLGLRHVAVQVVENSDGSIELFDDGFSDTPSTHYNQHTMVDCDQDLFQCGELVQVENYMDYCLECACMFTKQQAAFMRNFIETTRPTLRKKPTGISTVQETEQIRVYPNPASDFIQIEGNFSEAMLYNEMGQLVKAIADDASQIQVNDLPGGFYFLKVIQEDGKSETKKMVIL